ncbi:hypothetical protein PENSPDRAFT_654144 [Peniophora sp. CONT]|nr:hypothetical protein PENSPDRAFT_654144 [Peniophora sp. CONT]
MRTSVRASFPICDEVGQPWPKASKENTAPSSTAQPGLSNLVSMPLADIFLSPSTPLTDAQKQLVIDSILPIVLGAAKQQRPDVPVTGEKIVELRGKFTEDMCRWWINKAHEVRKEYQARGLPLPGAKRELEDGERQGREKRARTEDDERDVEMIVDDRTSTVTGEVSPPPAFSEPASPHKDGDVDMFAPPEVPHAAVELLEKVGTPVVEEEDEEEMDMDLDSDEDEPPLRSALASVPETPTPISEASPAPDILVISSAVPPAPDALLPEPIATEESTLPAPITAPPDIPPITPPAVSEIPAIAPESTPAAHPPTSAPITAPELAPTEEPSPGLLQSSAPAASEPLPLPAPAISEIEPAPAQTTVELPSPPEPELVYATTPGIWGIAAGTKMSTTLEFELVIDDATYDATRRWAARWDTFTDGPADAFVSVRLLCLPLAQVQELDAEVRSGTRSSAPADVAVAMAGLPITWPAPGALMVTNGKRSFYGDVFKQGTPFDVSSLILPGINTLRIFLIGASHVDKVYALHAAPPSSEEVRAVAEMWKAQRALVVGAERGRTSFGMPPPQLAAGEPMVVQATA